MCPDFISPFIKIMILINILGKKKNILKKIFNTFYCSSIVYKNLIRIESFICNCNFYLERFLIFNVFRTIRFMHDLCEIIDLKLLLNVKMKQFSAPLFFVTTAIGVSFTLFTTSYKPQ